MVMIPDSRPAQPSRAPALRSASSFPPTRLNKLLELDLDQIRAAAWELGHTVENARTFLRERLDHFVITNEVPRLYDPRRGEPAWSTEPTPLGCVLAKDIWPVLLDEGSPLSSAERCAAARVVGGHITHQMLRASTALDQCARLDSLRDSDITDSILCGDAARKHADAYRLFPTSARLPFACRGKFLELIPVDFFLETMSLTNPKSLPGLLRGEMIRLAAWETVLEDSAVRGSFTHQSGAGRTPR